MTKLVKKTQAKFFVTEDGELSEDVFDTLTDAKEYCANSGAGEFEIHRVTDTWAVISSLKRTYGEDDESP